MHTYIYICIFKLKFEKMNTINSNTKINIIKFYFK